MVHSGKLTPQLADLLDAKSIKTIVLPDGEELNHRLGMNFVTLASSKVVMPSGAPGIKEILLANGLEVHEVDVSEYLKAAGGLACLTGILKREELTNLHQPFSRVG